MNLNDAIRLNLLGSFENQPIKIDELHELLESVFEDQRYTPRQLRTKLAHDVYSNRDHNDTPVPLELPFNKALLYTFSNQCLFEWCAAAGIDVQLNSNPIPDFHSPTTVILTDIRHERTSLADCEDEEL